MTQTIYKSGSRQRTQARNLIAASQGPAKHVIDATVELGILVTILKCVSKVAFRKGNVTVQAGQTYFLVQSSKFTGRYYVVAWNEDRASMQCSCGASCKKHAHTTLAEEYIKANVVAKPVGEIVEEGVLVERVQAPIEVQTAISTGIDALREKLATSHVEITPEMSQKERADAWIAWAKEERKLKKQVRELAIAS